MSKLVEKNVGNPFEMQMEKDETPVEMQMQQPSKPSKPLPSPNPTKTGFGKKLRQSLRTYLSTVCRGWQSGCLLR